MGETTDSHGVIYKVERRRRKRRLWIWPVLAVVVLGLAAGIFLFIENSRAVSLGSISPEPDSFLSTQPLAITCELVRFVPGRGSVALTVDGNTVPAGDVTLAQGEVQTRLSLADGPHSVALDYDSGNLFSGHVTRTWNFTVDTAAPAVTVGAPASFPSLLATSSEVAFALSEPAGVSLTLDGAAVPVDPAGGAATELKAQLTTTEGEHTLVLTATDSAGNASKQSWDLIVDEKAPELATEGLPDAEVWKKQTSAAVTVTATDLFADRLKLVATLDGADLTVEEKTGAGSDKRVFSFDTGTLAEGTHSVRLTATDAGGHVTTLTREFLLNTSETFGARPLKAGAQGDDVKQLQRILKIKGVYTGDPTGTLDDGTVAAVGEYNSQHGVAGSEATEQTLKHLLGYLQIDLSERKLRLYDGDDKLVKTYGVAVGMAAYPTPVGSFRVIVKEKNPTWNPPDSAWAAGMGPVPPGPNNPLGTRWMGLNSPGIGIHGTPNPSSIGSAASHGCIRMKIPEAEDLFDRIFVGTPVKIAK